MSEPTRVPPSTAAARPREGWRRGSRPRPCWIGRCVLGGAGGWFLLRLGRGGGGDGGEPDLVVGPDTALTEESAGDRAVVLVFPEWDASGYVTENRRIPSRGYPEEDLRALLDELCAGPTRSGAVSALPSRTRVLAAFVDRDGRDAVLDFSAELVVRHPGGSAAEAATLTSILRTVALNFPELRTCRILVDGAQAETLGGHLALDESFDLRRWL